LEACEKIRFLQSNAHAEDIDPLGAFAASALRPHEFCVADNLSPARLLCVIF
jgi:hypothetical protein